MITTADIRMVVATGKVIEDYPDDPREHSCLLLGFEGKRPFHIVCSPKNDYLAIITAYIPDRLEWEADYQIRIKQ